MTVRGTRLAGAGVDRALGLAADLGEQIVMAGRALRGVPLALTHHRAQVGRVLAEVSLGSGIFMVGGGVVGVVLLLSTLTGSGIGLEGHNGLGSLGQETKNADISAN